MTTATAAADASAAASSAPSPAVPAAAAAPPVLPVGQWVVPTAEQIQQAADRADAMFAAFVGAAQAGQGFGPALQEYTRTIMQANIVQDDRLQALESGMSADKAYLQSVDKWIRTDFEQFRAEANRQMAELLSKVEKLDQDCRDLRAANTLLQAQHNQLHQHASTSSSSASGGFGSGPQGRRIV